ncbi:MAG TPA: hypothetical protein ENI88_10745 [Desulfobulbus sp.]|nr:hypothetical protein [Desulfobulbus sp.]
MARKKLEESEYEAYFDSLSKGMKEQVAEIEVMAVGIMDKEQTGWIPCYGISYDPPEKTISIMCEYIDHNIKKPREVWVKESDSGIAAIEITGAEGYIHLLKFKEPVAI